MRSRRLIPFASLAIFVATLLIGLHRTAADPPSKDPPTAFECRWADTPIKIDGKPDDEAWKHAQVIDRFYLPWLKPPRDSKTKTKARLLWDRDYIYFLAEMEDTDLFADVTEYNGQTWKNDVFELFFKPAQDKPGYYEFQVNAANTIMNVFFPRREAGGFERFKKEGAFHVDAKVVLDGTLNKRTDKDKGWSVEGRIPWADFLRTGGRPEPGEKWNFALCRYDYNVDFKEPDLSTCAPLTRVDFHRSEDYATLTFKGPDKNTSRPHGIEKFVPVTSSTVVGSPDPPPPYRMERLFPKLKINFPICVKPQPRTNLMLVIDQPWSYGPTRIGRIRDNPDNMEIETLLKLEDVAYDIVFHPKFADNGFVYIGSNGPHPSGKKHCRVTRYVIDRQAPYKLDPKSATVIIDWESDGHNGAAMAFGHDGMFYVTTGDGTSDSDTNIAGQDMTKLLAKVLRIDIDHPDPGKQYSVPKDNPFVGMKDGRSETWAFGLRNPWRMTVDEETGHLWVGQNGQDLWEQAFLVKKGDNYGWSVTEGSHPFYLNRKTGPAPIVKPTIEHHHSEFRSLTGGVVYYGKKFPELQGAYIYGDYSTGKIWGMKHDGTKPIWHKELADSHLQITWIGVDTHGELIVADHRGENKGAFFTFVPTPKDLPPSKFPRKLSESRLYESVKDQRMKPGVIPYSVNSPLWSDGAHKERWLMLPGENPKIDFSRSRGWNLPEKTVLVKSFALDTDRGRRWIETRFLTKQDGEWYGYSYKWNDAQTDAELIPAGGLDVTYRDRAKPWHFPSRAECMVCHSRAANFVLGLTEAQMNRDHDYGEVKDNQLRVLEHLGLFKLGSAFEEMKGQLREEAKAKGLSEKEINIFVEKQTATRDQRQPAGTSALLAFSPDKFKRLADPYDKSQDLDKRARSYLHSNCSQCHVDAGGGNAQMDLEFTTDKDKTKIFDVKPVHHTFGIPDAKLIAPGQPEKSVILQRVSHRGEGHMPPLATNDVDREAVEMLREWIAKMRK
jgi:uncharacterized repeat protein (TIGR03806 family)